MRFYGEWRRTPERKVDTEDLQLALREMSSVRPFMSGCRGCEGGAAARYRHTEQCRARKVDESSVASTWWSASDTRPVQPSEVGGERANPGKQSPEAEPPGPTGRPPEASPELRTTEKGHTERGSDRGSQDRHQARPRKDAEVAGTGPPAEEQSRPDHLSRWRGQSSEGRSRMSAGLSRQHRTLLVTSCRNSAQPNLKLVSKRRRGLFWKTVGRSAVLRPLPMRMCADGDPRSSGPIRRSSRP